MRHVFSRAAACAAIVGFAHGATAADAPIAPTGTPTAFVGYITSGLNNPIGIFNAGDGSNRLFINQKGGALRVAHGTSLNATPFLTIDGSTTCRPGTGQAPITLGLGTTSEQGLLAVAFHPQFATNGRFFLSFNDANGDTTIARYTMADPDVDVLTAADLATCTLVLRIDQDGGNHKGGNIMFGPDGYLYVGMGDGGGGGANATSIGSNDGCNRAQTLNPASLASNANCAADANFTATGGNSNSRALLGKMLRIDVDRTTPVSTPGLCGQPSMTLATEYAIPDEDPDTAGNQGNPFADGSTTNGCDEVWSYGLRNPWRWSFDRATGDLLIGDVGQGSAEEVDFEPASTEGRNYGWKCWEGLAAVNGCSPQPTHTPPVIAYGHTGGRCSITGGYRYRGPVLDAQAEYFYADYCTGEIWSGTETSPDTWEAGAVFQDLASTAPTFGEDETGNLYVVNGSQVWILDGVALPDPIFQDGFE